MELLKCVLTIVSVLHMRANVYAQQGVGHNDTIGENEGLRKMFKTVLEQNRRLALQNNRLQQVWVGMQQMCKALTMPTCDCTSTLINSSSMNKSYNVNNDIAAKPSSTSQSELQLRVMSIKSSGVTTDPTTVNIVYAATPNHTTDWIGPRLHNGMWRTSFVDSITAGTKTQAVPGSTLYTSTVDIEQIQTIRTMFFRLSNGEETVSVKFNLTEMEQPQQENITAPNAGLLEVNSTYTAPLDSDLNITAIVNKSVEEFHEFADVDVFFIGLNTSASPPAVFEISNLIPEEISISKSRRTNTTSNIVVTLQNAYVKYGGILTLRVPYRDPMNGMVEELNYGPIIKIFAPDTKEVVPKNTLGIFPLSRQTVVFPPTQSIMCAAMGNPRPNVTILKSVKGGKTKELATETAILDSYMSVKLLSFSAKQPKKTEGRYICRASNGNQTIDAPTEVVVLEPAVFDETKTGVVKNSSQVVVISCEAKGKPKPKLALLLYEKYGPDLIRSGMYKVSMSDPNKFTSRLTLTVSPKDNPDIHTVYCLAVQGNRNGPFEVFHKISVYPGVKKNNNWELYQRLQESQVF